MISSISSSTSCLGCADSTALAEKMFSRLDQDGDGKISSDEFTTALQKRFGSSATGDSDASAALEKIFSKLDADGDGQINPSEFSEGFASARVAFGRGGPGPLRPGGPPPDSSEIFAEADTDGSGTVTAEELKTHFSENILANDPDAKAPAFADLVSKLDADGDGELSESEFNSMFERARLAASRDGERQYDSDGTTISSFRRSSYRLQESA